MIRTVRVVAVAAILCDWRMLPKVWAAFLGVTVEARIIQGLLREL